MEKQKKSKKVVDESYSFQKEISQFVTQIESLSNAFNPTIVTLLDALKNSHNDLDDFINKYAVKKKITKEEMIFRIKPEHNQKFERLRKIDVRAALAVRSIPETYLVALISYFDAYLANLLRTLFYYKPDIVNSSQKPIIFSELMKFNSIEDARTDIIEKEIDSVMRESHTYHFDWMESKFGIPLRKDLDIWQDFIELTERRNLFVHCNGTVNPQYLALCKKNGCNLQDNIEVGKRLNVSPDYFRKSYNLIFELGFKLGQVIWRKYKAEEMEIADSNLIDIGFDLLTNEQYELAKKIFCFATQTLKKHASEINRKTMLINLAIATKRVNKNNDYKKILENEDWTACGDELKLAVEVLYENYDKAVLIMKQIGVNGKIEKEYYESWPLFKDFIYTEKFSRAYKQIFKEEFSIAGQSVLKPAMKNNKLTSPPKRIQ